MRGDHTKKRGRGVEFLDRVDAGRQLVRNLAGEGLTDPVVLALTRGGVPVAAEVAQLLRAPLDVLVVPGLEVASGAELPALREARPSVPLRGRAVVVVDEGLSTGATARAGCRAAHARGAARVVLAVPVGPADRLGELRSDGTADVVIAVAAPESLGTVAEHYARFPEVSHDEVLRLLADADRLGEIRSLAEPLNDPRDLDRLVAHVGTSRFVCLGEASHGTHEYYRWRAEISRRLIEAADFTWIGVEGDWPDCWRLNQWVRGLADQHLGAVRLLEGFERWPTWMWANREVAEFLDWLRRHNLSRRPEERVGFYGLDVYSLWDSLREVMDWVEVHAADALPAAMQAWQCFVPFREDPQHYAYSTRLVPETCEADVIDLLTRVRRQAREHAGDEAAFDAVQNAEVAAGAEEYYRAMVRADRSSWNVRDHHMADTVDRLAAHLGPASKGLIWEHNTHIGDARATDMASDGLVNVGQLLRERHETEGVSLIGFAGYRGAVVASSQWGAAEQVLTVPAAHAGSHEDLLHRALGEPSVLVFGDDRDTSWLSTWLGHRAIGVVYAPERERGNYVPTRMGGRYDALVWFEDTHALRPTHREPHPLEREYETEPSGL